MRIAVSGTHYSCKSTLIEEIAEKLPDYILVDEPYRLIEEEGYDFLGFPALEDLEEQLVYSIELLSGTEKNVIFNRCPVDFIAYSLSLTDGDLFDPDKWIPKVRAALKNLDLIVFVPLDDRDNIFVPESEDLEFRSAVDAKLNEILLEDEFNLDIEVFKVSGNKNQRREEILALIQKLR